MISNKDGLEYLANIFIKEGIKDIVISPGSRNAPMMLTFPEYEEFNIYSIIDERSAAFFALGIAHKTRRPVVLNCTSGSALLNYAPAIAEAYYQQIPLIVLSADRPEKLIDQGDGQAIQQQDVYRNYIRKSVHLPEEFKSEEDIKKYQKMVFEAIAATQNPVFGPVHINVPLDEPIYGLKEKTNPKLIDFKYHANNKLAIQQLKDDVVKKWSGHQKKMIIIGQNPPNKKLNKVLNKLAQKQDVVILSETTSNIHSDAFISKIDQTLTQINSSNEIEFIPDIIISIGGHIVSKKIKAWLRKATNLEHWHISLDHTAPNVFFHLTQHIQSEEVSILEELSIYSDSSEDFQRKWQEAAAKTERLQQSFMQDAPYSDILIYNHLQSLLKSKIQLHFANSTPVRYSQFFHFGEEIIIDSNRGVSGIDGSVSTALGQSLHFDGQTILVTGDLSFFYDNNALWNAYLHPDFKIILINNGGGGIFRFIEGPLKSGKIDLFETPHHRKAESLATDAGLVYSKCESEAELLHKLQNLIESDQASLLEIFTPREINDQVLKDYFNFLRTNHE